MARVRALAAAVTGGAALFTLAAAVASPRRQQAARGGDDEGRRVYQKWCAGCHGEEGRGDGPAAGHLLPKPRDFTRALFQIRSTATGELPTDADIRFVVDEGMPGTSMAAWKNTLSRGEREAVVRYIKSFSPAFATLPTPLEFAGAPRGGQSAIDSGRALYRQIECWKCHGDAGRGDGRSAPSLKDDFGNPIRASDLTQNWLFNGGGTVQDTYRRLRSGLDGTPMPSFSDLIDGGIIGEEDLWRLAYYVRSLAPEEPPVVREVVRAVLLRGELPSGPDDSAWARVERFYFPLVGQVIVKPRWFAPTVTGVWVQAVHDGSRLAMRVTWHDPSPSPDVTWRVWRARIASHMTHDDSALAADTTSLPDGLAVQFPRRVAEGMGRPYFLLGSDADPVYLWRWESAPRAAVEAIARGPDGVEPLAVLPDSLRSAAVYDRGEWRVQFMRALTTADSADRLQFVPGQAIPMALFVWDGSNGESGTQISIGSWVGIYLAEPGRAGVIVWPLLAMLSTGGLGVVVIVRAQRAAAAAGPTTDTAEAV